MWGQNAAPPAWPILFADLQVPKKKYEYTDYSRALQVFYTTLPIKL